MRLAMKNIVIILLISFGVISFRDVPAQQAAGKRCLIVAIGNYQNLKHISSANDVPLIRTALEKQGFTDFRILTDSLATKKNILSELTRLANDSKKGDVVVVHFSAHGQGIPDDNGDEPDGVDESICCYGAEMYLTDTYSGQEHLRDDIIGQKLNEIRAKTGSTGQMLVLLDACFSGSGTRGEGKPSRGVGNLLTKKNEKVTREIKGAQGFDLKDIKNDKGDLAPMTVFSASRADELNYEFEDQGSLSFAFNKALTTSAGGELTYRKVFAGINSTMSFIVPLQNPVAEGDGLDRTVFGSGLKAPPLYFTATEFDREKNRIKLSAGTIAGVFLRSVVAFYPSGTSDTSGKQPLFTGEVIAAGPLTSIVQTTKLPGGITPQSVWCRIKEEAFQINTIKIAIPPDVKKQLPAELMNDLSKYKTSQLVDDKEYGDLAIIRSGTPGLFNVVSVATGVEMVKASNDPAIIKKAVLNFAKARLFRALNFNSTELVPGIELIPVKFDNINRKITDTLQSKDFYSEGVFTAGDDDYFMIKVSNSGAKRAYFNIVSIDESSRLMLLIPWMKKNEDPANYYIEPGTEFIIPDFIYRFRNKTPLAFTQEAIMLVFTAAPLDLRYALMRSAGDNPGVYHGSNSILEEVMKMDDGFLNRGSLTSPGSEEISTFTFTIRKSRGN